MQTYVVSRHPGALEWLKCHGHDVSGALFHLDEIRLTPGDVVIGTLPVHLAAEVIRQGARYLHICMQLPASARGRELGFAEMTAYGAELKEYHVEMKHA